MNHNNQQPGSADLPCEQFRKKPVVINAIRWPGTKFDAPMPVWARDALNALPGSTGFMMRVGDEIIIDTLEGQMRASPGDWIIRGIKGELYPCKPDIFAASYEPAAPAVEQSAEKVARAIDALDGIGYTYDTQIGWLPPIAASRRTTVDVMAIAMLCEKRAGEWNVQGFPGEASAAEALAEEIRALAATVSAGQAVQVASEQEAYRAWQKERRGLGMAESAWMERSRRAAPVIPPDGAMPRTPTEAMLNAARDWSVKKYHQGIGNDAAIGCWQAMYDAAQPAEGSAQVASLAEDEVICAASGMGLVHVIGDDPKREAALIALVRMFRAAPERSDTPAEIRNAAFEQAASLCDRFGKREMHPAECAGAIRMMKSRIDGDKQGEQGDA